MQPATCNLQPATKPQPATCNFPPRPAPPGSQPAPALPAKAQLSVALLTAGRDKPYALGLAAALLAQGIQLDFIGSDEVSSPELTSHPRVRFLNLRGDQSTEASVAHKMLRVLRVLHAPDPLRRCGQAKSLPHPLEQ